MLCEMFETETALMISPSEGKHETTAYKSSTIMISEPVIFWNSNCLWQEYQPFWNCFSVYN